AGKPRRSLSRRPDASSRLTSHQIAEDGNWSSRDLAVLERFGDGRSPEVERNSPVQHEVAQTGGVGDGIDVLAEGVDHRVVLVEAAPARDDHEEGDVIGRGERVERG